MWTHVGFQRAVINYPFSLKRPLRNHSYQMWVRFFALAENRKNIWLEGEGSAFPVVGFHSLARDTGFIMRTSKIKTRDASLYRHNCSPRAALFAAKSRGVGGFPSFSSQRKSLATNRTSVK